MSLYKRGRVWWVERWIAGKRKRKSLGVRDRKAAEIKAADLLRNDELRAAGVETFQETRLAPLGSLVAEYTGELTRLGRSKVHVQSTKGRLERLVRGCDRVAELTPERVRRALTRLADELGLCAKTSNDYRNAIHGFFSWLVREGRWEGNPVAAVPKVRVIGKSRERRALSDEELRRLLGAAPPHRATCYLLAATSGLRRSELGALRWRDVDLVAATVTVRAAGAKNRREATLPLPPATVEALRGHRRRASGSAVFDAVPLVKTFYRDLERAEIPKKTDEGVLDFHALRATYATRLAREGVPLTVAQGLLRHSTPTLTSNVYTKLEFHDKRAAAESIDVGGAAESCGQNCGGTAVTSTDAPALMGASCTTPESDLRRLEDPLSEIVEAPQVGAAVKVAGVHRNRTDPPGCSPGAQGLKPQGPTRNPSTPASTPF